MASPHPILSLQFFILSESLPYHKAFFLGDGGLFQHFNSGYAHALIKVNGKCPLRATSRILRQVSAIHQKANERFISVRINLPTCKINSREHCVMLKDAYLLQQQIYKII